MPCDWERRSGVALATRHRFQSFIIHLQAQSTLPPTQYTPYGYGSLPFITTRTSNLVGAFTGHSYKAHRAVIFAIAQLSCMIGHQPTRRRLFRASAEGSGGVAAWYTTPVCRRRSTMRPGGRWWCRDQDVLPRTALFDGGALRAGLCRRRRRVVPPQLVLLSWSQLQPPRR